MLYSDTVFLTFVLLGMFCTLFVQLHQLRFKELKRIHKAQDAFVCSLLTASVCVPLFEYFPHLPYALCLPIGGAIGTLGFSGWQKFVSTFFDLILGRLLQMIDSTGNKRSETDSNKK